MGRSLPLTVLFLALGAIPSAVGPARAQGASINGLWSGTTIVTPPCTFSNGRCNAVNKITFTFQQQGDRIKGKYTCAFGTQNCRNGGADSTGDIVSGRLSGKEIRLSVVISADVSNCYYNGRLTTPTAIRGGYSCYQGGELLEEGEWNAKAPAE